MDWPGILTAMVTPFAADGSLNEEAATALSEWLISQGSGGLVIAGTTGEAPTLKGTERRRLYEAVRRGVGHRVPVWVGCGSNDTDETVARATEVERWGADGVMVVTPYYNKPPQEGLYRHFLAVARAISIPMMIYNVPGRTGVSIQAATVARIAQATALPLAAKEASGTLDTIAAMVEACPGVRVYSGDDALFQPALRVGAAGVVSVASHLVGPAMEQLWIYERTGQGELAAQLHQQLLPIMRGLFTWPNPIPVKWALNRLGHNTGPVRLPLVYPDDTSALEELLVRILARGQSAKTRAL